MSERLRIKFLIAIWGARYIHEFARISLPSYLAEGNIPHLAARADLEILIMTTAESRPYFDEDPAFARLRTICPVRFILIDDLVTAGYYGVTLTLAFARGIRDSGDQQTNTHFVFMNSDFVLSEGSLASMLGKLEAGSPCILAPSLRARSEDVLETLEDRVDERGVLSIPSRELVGLTLRTLHPTVIGKTVTQRLCTSSTHNQIYWQVDGATLLGRYHLIFMLAIKPEVPLGPVNSYCDYGLVPELVPSGAFSVMDDSDDFFMLELQPVAQEKDQLRGGSSSQTQIARQLAEWTTTEHRRFADVDVVFHSGDKPDRLANVRQEFASWFDRLRREMASPPVSHAGHYYWTMGLQGWAASRPNAADAELPPELGSDALSPRPRAAGSWSWRDGHIAMIARAKAIMGTMPDVPIWSHQWLDSQLLRRQLRTLPRVAGGRRLFLCGSDSALAGYFERRQDFDVDRGMGSHFAPSEEQVHASLPKNAYHTIVVHMHRADMRQTAHVLEAIRPKLDPAGSIVIYFDHRRGESDPSNFSSELAQYSEQLLPADWLGYRVGASFTGGRAKRWLRLAEIKLFGYLVPSSRVRPVRLIAAVFLWPVVAAMTALNNLLHRGTLKECPRFCSSFVLTFDRISGMPPARIGSARTIPADSGPVS